VPKPDGVNTHVRGVRCDAVYRDPMVIVELDGYGNHHSAAQIRRDRGNDLTLRRLGWEVRRYGREQLVDDPLPVRDDILWALASRAGLAAR
jgi:very-short-patch-repair endonuclease